MNIREKKFFKIISFILVFVMLMQLVLTFDSYAETKHNITAFDQVEQKNYTFTNDMSEEAIARNLPRTIDVHLDGDVTPTSIDVSWKCVEDFSAKKLFAYTFIPKWDEDRYQVSSEVNGYAQMPRVQVVSNDYYKNSSSYKGVKSSENDNEGTAYNYFKKNLGLPTSSACAMLQNLYSESGIMPNNVENRCPISDEEYTKRVDNGKYSRSKFVNDAYGYGLCQWTSSGRKGNLYDRAKSSSVSISNMNMQLGFLGDELKNSFPVTWYSLKNLPNTDTGTFLAAATMCFDFESPAFTSDTSYNRGINAVETYWSDYGGKYDLNKSHMGICGFTYPGNVNTGSGFPVYGVCASNYELTLAEIQIINKSGSVVSSASRNPKSYMFDLNNFDNEIKFGSLNSGTYTYKITIKNSKGNEVVARKTFTVGSGSTTTHYGVQTTSAPAAPEISASVYTHDSNIISWKKSTNPNAHYLIYRGTAPSGDWGNAIAEVANSKTLYVDDNDGKGLTQGKKYYYLMRTVDRTKNPDVFSDYSNMDYAVPNVPRVTGFSANAVNEKSCKINWNRTKSSKMQYWIYRGTKSSGDWGPPVAKLENSKDSYIDDNLQSNVKYYYMMRAVEVDGSHKYYGEYTDKDYGVTRDSIIESFSSRGIDTSTAYLQWSKNKDKSNYLIYRSYDSQNWSLLKEVPNSSTHYTDNGLTFGKTYFYKMRSVCYVDGQAYYGQYTKVDFAKPGVVPPQNVKASAKTCTSAKITWDKSTDSDVKYLLYRGTNPTGDWGNAIAVLSNSTTSYIDKDLTPGKRYYYMMRGYCMVDGKKCYSEYTNKDYASPSISDIKGFSCWATGKHSSKVVWDKSSDTEVKYAIYRGYAPSGDWGNARAFAKHDVTSYTENGLTSYRRYYYMMRPYCTVNGKNYFGNYTKVDYAYPR